MLLHCMHTACTYRESHSRSPVSYLLARQSSKAHKITMKLPSNWCSNVRMVITMGDGSDMPHPQCIGSQIKPGIEHRTCVKGPKLGSEYLQTYKTLHCVCTACTAFPYYMHGRSVCHETMLLLGGTLAVEF